MQCIAADVWCGRSVSLPFFRRAPVMISSRHPPRCLAARLSSKSRSMVRRLVGCHRCLAIQPPFINAATRLRELLDHQTRRVLVFPVPHISNAPRRLRKAPTVSACLLYTSDAADE